MGNPHIYLAAYNVVAQPLLGAWLLLRLGTGKSREGWPDRWGRLPKSLVDKSRPRVWVHAASVGEVMAAIPILDAYRARRPMDEILMTVITPGGHEVASKLVGKTFDSVYYSPFDGPIAVRRAVQTIQPDLYVGLETELWPNLLHFIRLSGARLALVNARLSDKSFPRYLTLRPLLRRVVSNFDRILAQTERDAERYKELGSETGSVDVFGNSKFDQVTPLLTSEQRRKLRRDLRLPDDAPVLVVGSTRTPEEETEIIAAYARARESIPNLALIHAPRHIDRAGQVESIIRKAGFDPIRRTGLSRHKGSAEQIILDTFGELAQVYAVADVAFVGNSLLPSGTGQNLLQPLAQGVPALYGRYMQDFRDLCALAEQANVGQTVCGAGELSDEIVRLIRSPDERERIATRALALINANRGASERYADALVSLMDHPSRRAAA